MTKAYIPRGFTSDDVRCASKQLPDPMRFALSTGNRRVRVAVPNHCDSCHTSYPSGAFLDDNYAECSSYMKILDFTLLAEYDYYTNKVQYVWKLVGGNQ